MEAISEKGGLLAQFEGARRRTLELVANLERDDYAVQTAEYASPPKWHLGHTSWLYEVVLGKLDDGYEPCHGEFSSYLNSYYHQFGKPHEKGRRGAVSRPTLEQIMSYFEEVSSRVSKRLAAGADKKAEGLFAMAVSHECQHQELMIYDLQHMLAGMYRPVTRNEPPAAAPAENSPVSVPGGMYELGHGGGGFCYDIELPEHRVWTDEYQISRFPVSNGEYLEFVESGGYGDFRYWLADGWEKARENGWEAPMYWERRGGKWHTSDFWGLREIDPAEPVVHVSFYEADAYCRWAGVRLPTEAEWEKAACWDPATGSKTAFPWGDKAPSPDRCNLLDSRLWGRARAGSYPGGRSHVGCEQMIGDVWEWTSSEFVGYPGFESGFDEYNDKWFTGQKVLRGGSFATPAESLRTSYRNFYRLDERWMLAGFRYALDAGKEPGSRRR